MIWESNYWKDDLLKKATNLRKRQSQQRWPESSLAALEQSLMLGFYAIRKLHDARKLSTATIEQQVSVAAYPWTGTHVTRLNWHKLDVLYDFKMGTTEFRSLLLLCHQFVHSFIFMAAFNEVSRLDGILFASDHQKHNALLHISIDQISSLFECAGNDYPNFGSYIWSSEKSDYDVSSKVIEKG